MDEKMFDDFQIGKWKWILYLINAHLIWQLTFVYVVEGIYYITSKSLVKYKRPF